MKPNTWLFLRSAGRAWAAIGHRTPSAPATGLLLEIGYARAEGATWEQIAEASTLDVATVRKHGEYSAT